MVGKLHAAIQAQIEAGAIADDLHQHEAIDALERLYSDLNHEDTKTRRFSNRLRIFVSSWFKKEDMRNIYLHGPVGRGKSMLMDLFYNLLQPSIPKRRVHFHAFMIEVHDFLHQSRQAQKESDGPDRALLKFADKVRRETRVLCFDEFHVVDVADAMILSRLFTALLNNGLVMIATSNWPPEKLYEGGLQRDRFIPFIDLVKSRFDVVAVDGGTDYRLRKLEDNGVYRWPLGHHASEWADALFHELSAGAPVERHELTVKGRVLEIPRVARGVARFSFAELCERPVGAEDYLSIARAYHTIFLEGVPKLRYDRKNEVKRLMILVDAMYDTGTRLVVTADAPPEKLYFGKDHGFEFERTVSRLLEMQSREWLEKTEARQG